MTSNPTSPSEGAMRAALSISRELGINWTPSGREAVAAIIDRHIAAAAGVRREATTKERERCTKIAEREAQAIGDIEIYVARKIANAIRAGKPQ